MRLRNSQNVSLEISSLFFFSEQKLEHVQNTNATASTPSSSNAGDSYKPLMKHKQFKVTIYGISSSDEDEIDAGIMVKVTQDTTVLQAIEEVCFLLC